MILRYGYQLLYNNRNFFNNLLSLSCYLQDLLSCDNFFQFLVDNLIRNLYFFEFVLVNVFFNNFFSYIYEFFICIVILNLFIRLWCNFFEQPSRVFSVLYRNLNNFFLDNSYGNFYCLGQYFNFLDIDFYLLSNSNCFFSSILYRDSLLCSNNIRFFCFNSYEFVPINKLGNLVGFCQRSIQMFNIINIGVL